MKSKHQIWPIHAAVPVGAARVDLVERIVVPIEGSDREFAAQQWAIELAESLGVPICAVHVNAGKGPPAEVFQYVTRLCKDRGIGLDAIVLDGVDVVETLTAELGVRDLVVIGTERLASTYRVGSVAAGLVKSAPCPVQMVRLA